MARYVVVNCKDYNGSQNVLFMMDVDDIRLTDPRFASRYEVLSDCHYDRRQKCCTTPDGVVYQVFADHSLKERWRRLSGFYRP